MAASKNTGLEGNMYRLMFVSREHNARQTHKTKTANKFSANVATFNIWEQHQQTGCIKMFSVHYIHGIPANIRHRTFSLPVCNLRIQTKTYGIEL